MLVRVVGFWSQKSGICIGHIQQLVEKKRYLGKGLALVNGAFKGCGISVVLADWLFFNRCLNKDYYSSFGRQLVRR